MITVVPRDRITFAVARWISIAGHPFCLAAILLFFATVRREGFSGGLRSTLTTLLMLIVPLGLFMVWKLRSGAWTTVDASHPRDRPAMYLFGLALIAIFLVALHRWPQMAYLTSSTMGVGSILVAGLLLNRWVKASMHLAFCAFAGAIAFVLIRPLGIGYLAFVPLLAWARVRMGRHTPMEVAVGSALGLIAGMVVTLP